MPTFGITLNRFVRNIVSIAIVLLAGFSFAHAKIDPIQSQKSNSFSGSDLSSFISNSNGATLQRDFGSHKSKAESFELIEDSDEDESYKKHLKKSSKSLETAARHHFAANFFIDLDVPVFIYACVLHTQKRSILFQVFRI